MSDTSTILTERTAQLLLMHPHLTPSRAYQIVLERSPELAQRHHAGDDGIVHQDDGVTIRETIPDPAPTVRSDPAAMRHYSSLSPDEQARYRPGERRLARGETTVPGKSYVHKMGDSSAGGGIFELVS